MTGRRLTAAERHALRQAISERRLELVQEEDARTTMEPAQPAGPLTPLQQHYKDLYLAGLSLRQIGAEVNLDRETIRRELQAAGVTRRPRGHPADTSHDETCVRLYAQERLSIRQIARHLGIDFSAVHRALKRTRTPLRPPGRSIATDGLAA